MILPVPYKMGQCITSACMFCGNSRAELYKIIDSKVKRETEEWLIDHYKCRMRSKDKECFVCEQCIVYFSKNETLQIKNQIHNFDIILARHCYFCDNTFTSVKMIDDRISVFPDKQLAGNIKLGEYYKIKKPIKPVKHSNKDEWCCLKCFNEYTVEPPCTLNCFVCKNKLRHSSLTKSIPMIHVNEKEKRNIIGYIAYDCLSKQDESKTRTINKSNIWHSQYTIMCTNCAEFYHHMRLLSLGNWYSNAMFGCEIEYAYRMY